MKTPRTVKILLLIKGSLKAFLRNEHLGLRGSLDQLDELGGIYIKFLQMIVLSASGQQQKNFTQLLKVYENSKPDDIQAWEYLQTIGMPNMERIVTMEREAFATGSFGQVYRARLDSGEDVIIKILRPSVKKYLRYDLRLLHMICIVYSLLDKQKVFDFKQIYKQFKNTCLSETHYKRETEVANYYYDIYQNHPNMVIPKTFDDMCTDQVIVQEYIDGISVAKLLTLQNTGVNARQYVWENLHSDLFTQLKVIGIELLSKALVGDVLQADPHPGNIISLANNKVALIDFGMATELSENRMAFFEMLMQYQAYYNGSFSIEELTLSALKYLSPKLYAAIDGAGRYMEHNLDTKLNLIERLKYFTRQIAAEEKNKMLISSMLDQNLIFRVMFFVLNRDNRFGFSFDIRSITLLKAAQGYLTLIGQFDEDTEIVSEVINGAVAFGRANFSRLIDATENYYAPDESIEILSKWIDKMSRKDPWLASKLVGGLME